MDYALKAENRKKFQDKQKLKRKHLTQSDRKYIKEKYRATAQSEENPGEKNDDNKESVQDSGSEDNESQRDELKLEQIDFSGEKTQGGKLFEKRKLQSNTYRYDKEQDEEFHNRVNKIVDDSLINDELRAQLRDLALKKKTEESNSRDEEQGGDGKVLTSANVKRKDLDSLTTKQLNELLTFGKARIGQDDGSGEKNEITRNSKLKTLEHSPRNVSNESNKRLNPTTPLPSAPTSSVPSGLQEEQDFLDGLL